MNPLDILPVEMWEQIFHWTDGAQNWVTLYRASPSFQQMVGAERTHVLFPLVLPHVFDYLIEGGGGATGTQRKALKGLLPLRLVSHRWKKSVDSMIVERLRTNAIYFFCKTDIIRLFLDKFESHSWNPVVFGQLSLADGVGYTTEDVTSAARLMDMFGNGVHTLCSYQLHYSDLTGFHGEAIARRVRRALKLAPKLEHLEVSVREAVGWNREDYRRQRASHRFGGVKPRITKLKSLNISGPSSLSNSVNFQNLLLKMFCSRRSLQKVNLRGVPSRLASYSNLTNASLKISTEQDLSILRQCSCPLVELKLAAHGISVRDIFGYVEQFKQTLCSLQILNFSNKVCKENADLIVDFPALKSLFVQDIAVSQICGHLPKLEVLKIRRSNFDREVANLEIVQSRIWQLSPKLKEVIIYKEYIWGDRLLKIIVTREQVEATWNQLASEVGEYHSWHLILKACDRLVGHGACTRLNPCTNRALAKVKRFRTLRMPYVRNWLRSTSSDIVSKPPLVIDLSRYRISAVTKENCT